MILIEIFFYTYVYYIFKELMDFVWYIFKAKKRYDLTNNLARVQWSNFMPNLWTYITTFDNMHHGCTVTAISTLFENVIETLGWN